MLNFLNSYWNFFSLKGYWFLHCHLEFHSEFGMGVVLKVGEPKDLPPVPEDFPTCGTWIPKKTEHISTSKPTTAVKPSSNPTVTPIVQTEKLLSGGDSAMKSKALPQFHHNFWIVFWCIAFILHSTF